MINFKAFVEEATRAIRAHRGPHAPVAVQVEIWERHGTYDVTFTVWDGQAHHDGGTPGQALDAMRAAYGTPSKSLEELVAVEV